MGMHDRDWYRDLQKERARVKPQDVDPDSNERHNPYYVKPDPVPWHPALRLVLLLVIMVVVYGFLHFFKR